MAFGKVIFHLCKGFEVQVKGLTHMFYFLTSFHKLYKEHVFPWLLTHKCICQFGMNEEMLDLKWKLGHEWNNLNSLINIKLSRFNN